MKLEMSRRSRRVGVRMLGATAVAALATTGLSSPAMADDPAIPNVSGVVTTEAGAGLQGVEVDAYAFNPTTGQYDNYYDTAVTGAGGAYTFEDVAAGNYKFRTSSTVFPAGAHWANSIPFVGEANGDATNLRGAPVVAVTGNVSGINFALQQYGLVTGVNTANGAPVFQSYVSLSGVDLNGAAYYEGAESETCVVDMTDGDCPGPDNVQGGQAFRAFVKPGTYRANLGGRNYTPGPPPKSTYFNSIYYGNTYSWADAKKFSVAAGQTVQIGAALTQNVANLVKARIMGSPAPGQKLRAYAGVWTAGDSFGYSWAVNGVTVANGPTYTVQQADLKKKITLTIQAFQDYDQPVGVAQVTTKVGLADKLKAKGKAAGNGKVSFKIKLKGKKLKGKFKGKVKIWYLPVGGDDPDAYWNLGAKSAKPRLVGKGKVGADGTATVTTKKAVSTGKGLFMVTYGGSKKAAANETAWKSVKVK